MEQFKNELIIEQTDIRSPPLFEGGAVRTSDKSLDRLKKNKVQVSH